MSNRSKNILGGIILLGGLAFMGYQGYLGTGYARSSSDRQAVQSCAEVSSLLEQTHDWMFCWVVSHGTVQATLQHSSSGWSWTESANNSRQIETTAEVVTAIKERLADEPGQLRFLYMGTPTRGYFTVDIGANGKVTGVSGYLNSD